jgi:hypothetical protein
MRNCVVGTLVVGVFIVGGVVTAVRHMPPFVVAAIVVVGAIAFFSLFARVMRVNDMVYVVTERSVVIDMAKGTGFGACWPVPMRRTWRIRDLDEQSIVVSGSGHAVYFSTEVRYGRNNRRWLSPVGFEGVYEVDRIRALLLELRRGVDLPPPPPVVDVYPPHASGHLPQSHHPFHSPPQAAFNYRGDPTGEDRAGLEDYHASGRRNDVMAYATAPPMPPPPPYSES